MRKFNLFCIVPAKFVIAIGLAASAMLTGCGADQPPEPRVIFVPMEDVATTKSAMTESLAKTVPAASAIAAEVNGKPILQSTVERRVQQLETAYAGDVDELQALAMNHLVERQIIEAAAQAQSITVSEAAIDEKLAAMQNAVEGEDWLAWLAMNNFTEADLHDSLRSQMLTADVFASVTENAPTTAAQVHARHIFLADRATAETILARATAGESFAALAMEQSLDDGSRAFGGDLGWFPRGGSDLPAALEEVAFSLEPGTVSDIIESVDGFHLLKVDLKQADRPLTPEHRQAVKMAFFNDWLSQQKSMARVEIYQAEVQSKDKSEQTLSQNLTR